MIKLKKILKESKYAWDRKFGDPLPTFKDVAETHQNKPKEELKEYNFSSKLPKLKVPSDVSYYERDWVAVFKEWGNKDYGPNELSKAVIGMMSQTFDYADDAAKIPADQRVLNAAKAAQEGFDPENAEIVDGEIVSKKPENKNQEQIDSIKRQIEELKKNTKKDTNYYTKLGELEADLEELGAK